MKDIRDCTLEEISTALSEMGEKGYRAKQIYEWLWIKCASSFDEMTNLGKSLREKLKNAYSFNIAKPDLEQVSKDGTVKIGFRLSDDSLIEGVLIPTDTRMTVCVSSQVGCSLSCTFCATGFLERKRNLKAYEIFDQVARVNEIAKANHCKQLSNIVFMGMGEPLLNYSEVAKAIDKITSPEGLGMSPSRITLSTAGIVKMIVRMADDEVRFNLALSLHAATDEKRVKIMPITATNSLAELTNAINYFYEKTKSTITLEYCVINEINDGQEDANELSTFANGLTRCKVNLIEYNPIELADYKGASGNRLYWFANRLESKGVIVNVRRSRGKDIDAACGQLANKAG